MQFTLSLGIGLALGAANWLLWKAGSRKMLRAREIHPGLFFVIAFLKLGLIGGAIWFLLAKQILEPIGFLTGFSIIIFVTLYKGLKWN